MGQIPAAPTGLPSLPTVGKTVRDLTAPEERIEGQVRGRYAPTKSNSNVPYVASEQGQGQQALSPSQGEDLLERQDVVVSKERS